MTPESRPRYAFVRGELADSAAAMMPDHERAARWLKRRIELLADELPVMWSRSAYTARRTAHVQFANGEVRIEGEEPRNSGQGADPLEMAEATLKAVRNYRASISGPAGLVWRVEPEVTINDGVVRVYTRLCFEPEIAAEAVAA